jgi:glucosamine--fructose-6-phosphate aminotransferase (isomerizing)
VRRPGALFLSEVRGQPDALARLLEDTAEHEAVAKEIAKRAPAAIRLVGHGSSDAAASYGVYAFGVLAGLTAMRDSISLTTYYDAKLDVSNSVVIGLSQSGRTQDVVEYVSRMRERGAFTVAITNDARSTLAGVAEVTLPLRAGPERSVAASKTYMNQLTSLALLAGGAAGKIRKVAEGLRKVGDQMDGMIDPLGLRAREMAPAFTYVERMFVVGRGFELATAREVALKLTETCRVTAEPLTATDLAHGPVAAIEDLFPVWTIASHDETLPAVIEAAARARAAGATLVASGSAAARIPGASFSLPVPRPARPAFAPLLSVVAGQLFAAGLALAKGLDADHPEQLSKVTLAQ